MAATIVINSIVWNRIFEFYDNVEKKYPNTWDINDTIAQINEIEQILKNFEKVSMFYRIPIISYWKENNWRETWHNGNPWHFAFNKININNTRYIYINDDAEHQENIHESVHLKNKKNKTYKTMNRVRLTESQLHRVIRKCVNEALNNYPNNDESKFKTMDRINGYEVDYSDNLVRDVENALDAYEKFSDALDDLFRHYDIDEIRGLKLGGNGGFTTQALVNAYQKLKFA